jgi:glyoxylase-like metal-dependent hydrolase (beta-lactamase superfamily II)
MAKTKMSIKFYPVGNADSALIENEDGRYFLIDYYCVSDAEDDKDDRIFLKDELDERLKNKDLEALMITHAHDDHFHGFSDYFWLNYAKEYQSDKRKKINELWVPDAIIWEARYRLLDEKKGIPVVANLSLREKQIQQNYRPIIAVHKWFARRRFAGQSLFLNFPQRH